MVSVCGVRRQQQFTLAVCLDILMLATGLLGLVVRSAALGVLLLGVSTAAMVALLAVIWRWFSDAIAASPVGSMQRGALRFCRVHTMLLWCFFPSIVAFEALCPERLFLAELCYAIGDFGAKGIWAALMTQGNVLVVEQQRRSSRIFLADVAQGELIARLRAALTLRDRLRAATGHELRTPLNAIVGLADRLLTVTSPPAPAPASPPGDDDGWGNGPSRSSALKDALIRGVAASLGVAGDVERSATQVRGDKRKPDDSA